MGQVDGKPSGEPLQSWLRIIWPIAPPPDKKRKAM
jgi:hypothetical protein